MYLTVFKIIPKISEKFKGRYLQRDVSSFVLQELSEAFDSEAKDNRKSRLQLTATVAGLRTVVNKAYEVEKIVP